MGKISRKKFVQMDEIANKNAASHIKFVDHVNKVLPFIMGEIEKLQARVTALEPVKKDDVTIKPST